jgi:hypothetical protein
MATEGDKQKVQEKREKKKIEVICPEFLDDAANDVRYRCGKTLGRGGYPFIIFSLSIFTSLILS